MNCSLSLSSLVCILSAGFACAADAQSLRPAPADTPAFTSPAAIAPAVPIPRQRSAQTATVGAATSASDSAAPGLALRGILADAEPESRARGVLRRPLVPSRPGRPKAASASGDGAWDTGTLYASPYTTSPYAQPSDTD
ncbi:MAG: hypothetical protein LBJ65_18525 [Burkholderia sp.]|jgi:hypothetical protein|uniref:hypothetical protein n=1 Tax=Burkholderia sp. TaxID=36773 RepID=UPI0028201F58|nr:hypothetical protein [Burkholderia sp.]MDR0243595.1 hypothetical protein [Burkholderia sp.]